MHRVSLRFSADAAYASSLIARPEGGYAPEHWTFDGGVPQGRMCPLTEALQTELLPTVDGRLLIVRHTAYGHRFQLVDPATGAGGPETAVGGQALRLVASPAPDCLGLAIGSDGTTSTVYRVVEDPLGVEPLAALPGRIGTTCWWDAQGRVLSALVRDDGPVRAVLIDLRAGSVADAQVPAGARPLLTNPRTGLLLVLSDAPGHPALGVAHLDDPASVAFPQRLNAFDGSVTPLALDPDGRQLALRCVRGARSVLLVHDLAADRTTDAGLPDGAVFPVAGWAADGLRVAYSTVDEPARLAVVRPPYGTPATNTAGGGGVQRFATPDGEFEAVCYGDWRTATRVVVALHGGPESAWQLCFDPILHRLAGAGLAIVAPNQRGSTNYGTAHAEAIHGRWGGPDLADIRGLVRVIGDGRAPGAERPMLYGASYGAYLALLAAAADPHAWSRCAVVAPFLSGQRLWAEASAPIRAMINRLGGRPTVSDDLGPRDLIEVADRITVPLLIVHGSRDENVPVTQSRALLRRLLDAGHPDLAYAEVPGAGHSPLIEAGGAAYLDQFMAFLTRPMPARAGAGA